MLIPGQLPQIVTAARSSALQALALKAGQVVTATVIGPAPNGGTQLQLAGQMLNIVLPTLVKAGEALRFEVQGSGAQLRLALQLAPAAASPTVPATPAAPAASTAAPAIAAPQPQSSPAATSAAAIPNPAATATPAAIPGPAPNATPPSVPAVASAAPGNAPGPAAPVTPAAIPAAAPATAGTPAPVPAAPSAAVANPPAAGPSPLPNPSGPPTQPSAALRPAIPYAQAPQANPASASLPPGAAAAPRAATMAPGAAAAAMAPTTAAPSAPAAPPIPVSAALPSTPQAALAQMVQNALPQQNSIAGLTTALNAIARSVALPEPVARAARQVLASQLDLGGGKLDGSALQKAVLNAGIFQEAGLARAGTPLLAPQADLKTALLTLRQTLAGWLGPQLPVIAAPAQIAPPLRGKFPRVTGSDIPPIDPAAPADEAGKHLLDRTEAALSRLQLHQHASLPDPALKGAEWSMELPVVIAGHQTLLQLQIHRDDQSPGESVAERGWQLRFAITLPDLGEVGAQVSLRGQATTIMLWAIEPATATALEADIDALRSTLSGIGLTPGAIIVRHGAPPAAQPPVNSGHLVDAMT